MSTGLVSSLPKYGTPAWRRPHARLGASTGPSTTPPDVGGGTGAPTSLLRTSLPLSSRTSLPRPGGAEGDADDGCFVRVHCKRGTDTVVAATVLAPRAGEIISELTLAIQEGVGLGRVARVIHPYPTTAEAVMGCGLQYIRKHWETMPPRKSAKTDSQ